jgi:transposase InsO family protein
VRAWTGLSFHISKLDSFFTYQGKRLTLIEENGMYIIRLNELLRAEEFDAICSIPGAATDESIALAATYTQWHERLGHASQKRLKFMYDNGMAEGFDVGGKHKHEKTCKCANCLSIHNAKIRTGDTRKFDDDVTQRGELVCTDLEGPFPADVHGYRYVISFTDLYSRFGSCYFLTRKFEAESALKAYLLFYRREGVIVKRIRSDNGGEFGGHQDVASRRQRLFGQDGSAEYVFDRVCTANNIIHELTPHHRPELNGLAERWNQTVIGMANSILFSARLSHVLWTSAVAHANMIRNGLPIQDLVKFTPYELWYHKRPRVDQLKVFGCE